MEIAKIDKSGRLVIPKEIRKKVSIDQNSHLLIADIDRETILIRKLNKEEIAERLKEMVK